MFTKQLKYILLILLLNYTSTAFSLTFTILENSDIVGAIQTTIVNAGQSLGEIGREFDVGVYEMMEANPNLNPWEPKAGASVIIPTEFILPVGRRRGIIINLAEMRIYYFHANNKLVTTHPIGIGKKGWHTPLGQARITQKRENPYWRPPASIKKAHAAKGNPLPEIVPPGPNNPLGKYAMRLSIPGYLIHGTNRPGGIGVRSTSGCIRLFPEDIKALYPQINIGTPVKIIHTPYKFGQRGYSIFLEAHQPLSERYYSNEDEYDMLKQALEEASLENINIDLNNARQSITNHKGYPILIN